MSRTRQELDNHVTHTSLQRAQCRTSVPGSRASVARSFGSMNCTKVICLLELAATSQSELQISVPETVTKVRRLLIESFGLEIWDFGQLG